MEEKVAIAKKGEKRWVEKDKVKEMMRLCLGIIDLAGYGSCFFPTIFLDGK